MAGRGGSTVKRRTKGRGPVLKAETGRTVSEEITVLMNTLRELAAIRSTAEDAAGRILQSAEGLLAFADKEEAKKAEEAIMSIMTACGFHDLVGQRVTKITTALDRVIATHMKGGRGRRVQAGTSKRRSKLALEGPGHPGASQASIDALFSEN